MAWDEWEQLKATAAEQHTAHMQLNELQTDGSEGGTPNSGSSGTGTLKHSGGPWTRAAKTADDLESSTTRSRTDLHSTHGGVASGLEGLASMSTLKSVLASWEKRLGRVREECDALQPKLRQVAVDMGEIDVKVGAQTDAVRLPGTRRGA